MADAAQQALGEALARVRGRISQIRERGDYIGEQDTKASLIEPVLAALGWQLDELDEVRREYKRKPQDNPVDYALLVLRSPRLFVEAKSLGMALDRKCAGQIIGYASMVGVGWCLVTNGDEYRIYNAHAALDVDEKLFRTVRVSDPTQQAACMETLSLLAKERMGGEIELESLWKTQFVDRHLHAALDKLFACEDAGLIKLIRKEAPELSALEVRDSLRRARLRVDFPVLSTVPAGTPPASASASPPSPPQKETKDLTPGRITLARLIEAAMTTAPLELKATYKSVHLAATVSVDGTIIFEGRTYGTPSAAGGAAKAKVNGNPEGPYPSTNGWTFWQYRDQASGEPRYLDHLLRQYANRNG
jgi:hypothetical protein